MNLNLRDSLSQKKEEEQGISSQVGEYKSCVEGIVNAKNVLSKMNKKDSPQIFKSNKKEDVDSRMPIAKESVKKIGQPIEDEFWFEPPKPSSKQNTTKPKSKAPGKGKKQ